MNGENAENSNGKKRDKMVVGIFWVVFGLVGLAVWVAFWIPKIIGLVEG